MMKFKANGWALAMFIASSLLAFLLCAAFGVLTYVAWLDPDAMGRFLLTVLLFLMITLLVSLVSFFYRKCYYSVEVNKERTEICITYPFRGRSILVKLIDLKGYSKSNNEFSLFLSENQCITLYLLNGDKIDLNQYQFRQFSKFGQLLEALPLTFLGTELFEVDLWGNRIHYKY